MLNIKQPFVSFCKLRFNCFGFYSNQMRFSQQTNTTTEQNDMITNACEGSEDKLYKTVEVEVRSAEPAVLKSYQMFASMAANELGITLSRTWQPFRSIHRRTLLRSAFVKKKYRVQYEFRTYFRVMEFKHLTGSTADTFLEYIQRNLPEGVSMKVHKTSIESLPPHIIPQQTSDRL